jgi:hypothetical protein
VYSLSQFGENTVGLIPRLALSLSIVLIVFYFKMGNLGFQSSQAIALIL